MSTQFNQFKTRYIFVDFWLLSNILGIILLFFVSFKTEVFKPFSVSGNIFHIIIFSSICGLIVYRLKYCQINIKSILGDFNLKNIPWIILLIVFYGEQSISNGINYLEYYFANLISPELLQSTVNTLNKGADYSSANFVSQVWQYFLLMIVLVIVAPVTEEFIFRGVFLHRWAVKWGAFWSIILSSLLFGAIHADIFWFSRAVGSIFIALLYIKTRTLLVPIILHALNNGLVFVNLLFHHFDPNTVQELNVTNQYLWYGLVNILLGIPILIYFLKFPKDALEFPYFLNQKPEKS